MTTDQQRSVLTEHLDRFRSCSYKELVEQIAIRRKTHDCLGFFSGMTADNVRYEIEVNVFWDDQQARTVRVCGDLTLLPPRKLFGLPIYVPNLTDSFIMQPDGNFLDE